jgi:hypothetical protein
VSKGVSKIVVGINVLINSSIATINVMCNVAHGKPPRQAAR